MSRRGRGEGTIYESNGYWIAQITLPNGKRKTKSGKTQKEVRDWLLEQRKAAKDNTFVMSDKVTVAEYLDRYLKDYAERSVRPSTYRSYENMINWHILPDLGPIKLTKLNATHLNHLYAQKLESGLSTRTVEYIHGILRRSLNKAVEWGLIIRNPTDTANPPRIKKNHPNTWTAEQSKAFLDHIKDDRWAGIYYLAMTGMREGEILGLPLSALNLAEGNLKVIQGLQFIQGKGLVITEPKTDESRRLVVLPEFIRVALKLHLEKRAELAKSPKWQETGFVFTTNVGTPISPRNLIRHFKTKLKEIGLPEIRFHDLRHTTASILLAKNTHPKVVQELLGHSTITLTLNTYSHLIESLRKDAAEKLDDIFSA